MPDRPRLLDLYCGAGGATRGYQEAGFYVVGVDKEPQPHYCGDEFVQMDALDAALEHVGGTDFDAIHASPPCQASSSLRNLWPDRDYLELIPSTRELLTHTSLPYVIENVEGAALRGPIVLCGSGFGLDVRRHRHFETNFPLLSPGCAHGRWAKRFRSLDRRQKTKAAIVGVHGSLNYAGERAVREAAMQIDWMSTAELSQAIPPAYTRHIGEALMVQLAGVDAIEEGIRG